MGFAAITGESLERDYASDQANFPMDYKFELIECDPEIGVVLLGAAELTTAKEAIERSFTISATVREQYSRARNASFCDAMGFQRRTQHEGGWPKLKQR